jgi:deoxyadenosine/deoxycytidine kinase
VTERSVFTDREIFAKMLHDEGKIEDIEYTIYLKWFDELVGDIRVDGIIYVRVEAEVAHRQVVGRNRPGETIPLDYLTMCHEYHERWLVPKMMLGDCIKEVSLGDRLSFDIDHVKRILVNPTEAEIRTWFRLLPLARD